ncbi:unnamed protein product [Rotaria sp. Silwood2]|nr:unnamed protein product [Rotaria sp. Silwood2]CAF4335083.1 unnamed protein product [Rotaria sp. Silwood2]CAF4505894.1 unnamed protein product [Rotaria sp. Silwood2]
MFFPKMWQGFPTALAANIKLLNDVGLNPSIVFMLAMKLFEIVRTDDGCIDAYVLYCSVLPVPEYADIRHLNSSPLDVLSVYLSKRLSYEPNQRDIVILHYQVGVTSASLSLVESELKIVDMVVYDDEKYDVMTKTIVLPIFIATQMLLEDISVLFLNNHFNEIFLCN